MRRYESVIILDPELPDEDIQGFTEKFTGIIKTSGGEIIKIEDWGAKKLAYPVKKRDRGRYLLLDFVGLPALIAELERQFKITEEVMKFLSVKVEDKVDLGAFRSASEKLEANRGEGQAPQQPNEGLREPQLQGNASTTDDQQPPTEESANQAASDSPQASADDNTEPGNEQNA